MSTYLLLRNNQELGPYTFEELEVLPLRKDDLVWVSGRSTNWERPDNIEELSRIALLPYTPGNNDKQHTFSETSTDPAFSLPGEESTGFEDGSPAHYRKSPAEMHSFYSEESSLPKESFLSRFAWVFVSAAILLAGFLITKMVADSDKVVMPQKLSTSAPKQVLDNTENFQNALTREFVFVPDSSRTPKKTKPKNIRKQVDVIPNDYRVGLFGGINNLELTIENNSDQIIDKMTIQVDYLKPNGDVISSETVSVKEIKPDGSKTIKIPSSSRGVKIKYKVLDIESHEFKPAMSEI